MDDFFFLLLLIFFLFYFIKFLFYFIFLIFFLFFIFYWSICCLCVCAFAFKLIFIFCFFPALCILCAVFISLRVGLGLIFCWSEIKTSYFGVVYNILSVGMELAVIKELFIVLYI